MYTHSDIESLLQKGIQMLKSINIPVSDSVCPRVDFPKAHSFYGYCWPRQYHQPSWMEKMPQNYKYYIRISEFTLNNSEKSIMNTILHELLHTCPGCMNHQKQWQTYAAKVNREFGYNIKRCAGDKTAADREALRAIPAIKTKNIVLKCSCCGNTYVRTRESRATLHPELYRCGKCHSTLIRL